MGFLTVLPVILFLAPALTVQDKVSHKFSERSLENSALEDLGQRLNNLTKAIHQVETVMNTLNSEIASAKRSIDSLGNTARFQNIWKISNKAHRFTNGIHCTLRYGHQGGGWTYIHKRFDGSQDFQQNWNEYKNGFGTLNGEFWLGLEHIYQLAGHESSQLLIQLTRAGGEKAEVQYPSFLIGSEKDGYAIKELGQYSGTHGDSLTGFVGNKFSTKDVDQDGLDGFDVAKHAGDGGWWYGVRASSNLNGIYGERGTKSIFWFTFGQQDGTIVEARMMVRTNGN